MLAFFIFPSFFAASVFSIAKKGDDWFKKGYHPYK